GLAGNFAHMPAETSLPEEQTRALEAIPDATELWNRQDAAMREDLRPTTPEGIAALRRSVELQNRPIGVVIQDYAAEEKARREQMFSRYALPTFTAEQTANFAQITEGCRETEKRAAAGIEAAHAKRKRAETALRLAQAELVEREKAVEQKLESREEE